MGTKRRIFAGVNLVIIVFVMSIYFTFIHHPPVEQILKNQGSRANRSSFELDPHKQYTMAEISNAAWEKWLYQNNHVSIGDVFDAECGKYTSKYKNNYKLQFTIIVHETLLAVTSTQTTYNLS